MDIWLNIFILNKYINILMNYRKKYLKYKKKYLVAKKNLDNENIQFGSKINSDFDNVLTSSNNQFTIDIFNNFDGSTNIFSPISLLYSLSLIQLAADGKTDRQLTHVLEHKYTTDDLEYLSQILNGSIIKSTNMFIVNDKYHINPNYKSLIKDLIHIVNINFKKPSTIVNKINYFVETNTNGMIKEIVNENDIDVDTSLVLINTVYFKSQWKKKFNEKNTTKKKFHRTSDDLIDMMHQIGSFNYYENKAVQLVEMLYSNEEYTMGIILPRLYNTDSVDYTINNVPIFTAPEINEYINNCQYVKVDLSIPKFIQRKKYDMVTILKKMGITHIFNENADLNILTEKQNISKIIHESVIIVDESGTEASSTTVVTGKSIMSRPSQEKPVVFIADHPFVYYIRYIPSNLFLFFGDYQG
ncbi:serine protease inhibitor [Cotonvirus japonicus]|uniref:Serine protease inhibitor n=1 Tax=Cotonvirus japonicus TaxID=2811091 RepID=A0ABM7NRU7_9VIRU|nr:serine protease inhibitor [Cotonvirus japonicus]BCS82884.1 serine protease inhibitor [Cotonvirus japonicus]